MIGVTLVDANTYEVVVQGTSETRHRVTLSQEYYRQLCGATVTHEWLLVQAFRFLLEREPNTAILPSFDLNEVARFFPEFADEIRTRLT